MKATTRSTGGYNKQPGYARLLRLWRGSPLVIAAVLLLQLFAAQALAEFPVQTWQVNPTSNSSGTWSIGALFRPNVNGTVNQLGGRFTGSRTVKLYQGSTVLATTTVTSTSSTWSYVPITPVNVTAGVTYKVVVETAGGDYWWNTSGTLPNFPQTVGSVDLLGCTYVSGTGIPDDTAQITYSNFGLVDIDFQGGSPPTPPAAPTGLSATTGTNADINLSWNDNSSDESGFRIERKLVGGSFATVTTTAANVSSYNDNGLTPLTDYVYRVFAVNGGGDSSSTSEQTATSAALTTIWTVQDQQATGVWNNSGVVNNTMRTMIRGASISNSASSIQITLEGRTSGSYTLNNVTITNRNGSTAGGVGSLTPVTFGGSQNVTVPANSQVTSDVINFSLSPGQDVFVTFWIGGNPGRWHSGGSGTNTWTSTTDLTSQLDGTGFNPTYNWVYNVDNINVAGVAGPANFVYGMWNWDSTILGDDERIAELIQYCLDLGITDLGFAINWSQPFGEDPNNIPALRSMISRMHDNGIKVEMVAGDASWIYHTDLGPLQGVPEGGLAFDFGSQLVERFIEYQNAEWNAAQPNNCDTCFDGIRLDVEPHGLRETVTNSMFNGWPNPDPNDPRVDATGGAGDVSISGFSGEPLLWLVWNATKDNGLDPATQTPNPLGGFDDNTVAARNEILNRFWDALKRFKGQLQDDRGTGHITNDPAAVAQHLVFAADQVPWYWTVGVQDEDGVPIVPENHLMVDHDDNAGTADIEVFKAALGVPDRIALMGYRDQYEHRDAQNNVLWFRSVKQWDEGHNLDDPTIGGPRGALPYLDSIGKPTSVGLEFIDQQQLGFNSVFTTFGEDALDPVNHPHDPYSQLKDTITQIGDDMLTLYPNSVEGIRYHEYFQPIPGKSSDAGQIFPTLTTWTDLEVFPSNLADWQTFHNVTPTTAILPPLNSPPAVPNGDSLTLNITNFQPGPGLTGSLQATVNGLPGGTAANDFHIVAYVKVIGDANYFQGGKGVDTTIGGLTPAQNGQLDASGNFEIRPIRVGDVTAAKIVWWLDLRDSNGHFIRRFVLDPITHCTSPGVPAGCVPDSEIPGDRFYDPNDPLNIDVTGILPTPLDLTFSSITINGDIQKSAGANAGSISGTISGFPAGASPTDFHVRTWVEFTHEGHDPIANTDPNGQSETNVWNLLSSDVAIDASGNFTATNVRPVNATGDTDAFGGTNGGYKIWISVHDDSDGIARIGCPNGLDAIKPAAARFLDMDFSLADVHEVGSFNADVDVQVQLLSVDNSGGLVAGNATGLDPTKTYKAYVWTEWYDIDKNIWQERAEPIAANNIDISKGGYFQIPITQLVPSTVSTTTSNPARNIWVSIHDQALDLNEFDIIDNWTCGGADPAINQSGSFPLWLGRFFHMDSSFDYYEGFRPAPQTGTRNTATPTAVPTGVNVSAIDAFTVKLDWTDASTNEVGFKIEQQVNGGGFVEVAKVAGKPGSGNAMTWTFNGLNANTLYGYRVRAFNVSSGGADVNSGYSLTDTVTTPTVGPISISGVTWNAIGASGWTRGTLTNLPAGTTYRLHVWVEPNSGDPTQYHQGREENVQNGVQFDTNDGGSANNGLWPNALHQQTMAITIHDAALDTIGSTSHPTVSNVSGLSSLPGVVAVFVGTEIDPNANNVD